MPISCIDRLEVPGMWITKSHSCPTECRFPSCYSIQCPISFFHPHDSSLAIYRILQRAQATTLRQMASNQIHPTLLHHYSPMVDRTECMLTITLLPFHHLLQFPFHTISVQYHLHTSIILRKQSKNYRCWIFLYNNSDCHYKPNSCSRYCFVEPICCIWN